jgi:DNA-binding LacI/PurR family transcriptional regulator
MPETIEKSAKLSDVARAAGVSQGTVSNVFNRPNLVREEVREHVREIARRLGYKGPDPKGRLLRAGKVNAIGIATAEPLTYFFEDPYARGVMEGIAETADKAGAGISLVSAANDEALAWNIQSALVDGFVLFCIEGGERLVRLTRERQLPFIALALGTENDSVATVGVDSRAGGRLAAEHLLRLGHRKFAVVALPVRPGHHESGPITLADVDAAIYSTSRDRVHGYFDVLSAHGIDTSAVPIVETQNDVPTVHAALESLFGGRDRPTALLVQSDRAALIAIDWLQARGLDVPADVSVIGFDGIAEAASSRPPLTTIAQPLQDIGRHAVSAILENRPQERVTLPVELVARQSTAAPRR